MRAARRCCRPGTGQMDLQQSDDARVAQVALTGLLATLLLLRFQPAGGPPRFRRPVDLREASA
jgi:hypothetical protein